MQEFITNSVAETEKLALEIIAKLDERRIVALTGNLGAGKTVLVQAIAKQLGVKENITSPTFVLLKIYPLSNKKFNKLVHIDCYRLDKAEDLADIGLEDYLADEQAILLIEWAEKIKHLPQHLVVSVKIELLGGQQRKISIV